MKTILYISSNFRRCGPVKQLLNILSNLDRKKFNPVILTLSPEPVDSMMPDFNKLSIRIDFLNLGRIQGMIRGVQFLKKYVLELNPDMIHTQGLRPDLWASKLDHVRHVNTVRMDPGMDYPMKFGKYPGAWMKRQHLAAIRKIDHPVLCSVSLQKIFEEKYDMHLPAIPNGVDTDHFKPASKEEKQQLRKKYEIPADHQVFIYTGSLITRKNLESLILAFTEMPEKHILLIAGDGSSRKTLMEIAAGRNNIIFTGQVKHVRKLLQLSDIFVSPSLSEGLPNTVLEAMACGLPVLLSDIPQHNELFSSQKYHHFFEVNNGEDLLAKMKRILQSDKKPLQEQVLCIARQNYSAKHMCRQYESLYEKISS